MLLQKRILLVHSLLLPVPSVRSHSDCGSIKFAICSHLNAHLSGCLGCDCLVTDAEHGRRVLDDLAVARDVDVQMLQMLLEQLVAIRVVELAVLRFGRVQLVGLDQSAAVCNA